MRRALHKVHPAIAAVLALCAVSFPVGVASQPQNPAASSPKQSNKQNATAQGSVHMGEGQRIFQQNCSRCHNALEGFSPRISGTIIRHMRVRASLSKKDEKDLLRFLNP